MSSAVLTAPVKRPRKHKAVKPQQSVVLHDIGWAGYRALSEALNDSHTRLTFDRGVLEIMTKSRLHEVLSRLYYRLLIVLTEEHELPLASCGSMTCDREDLEKGAEADESFYIVHAHLIRGKKQIDLANDPPPDLMVEIDISSSSQRRLGIYSAIKVPEVWCVTFDSLKILQLDKSGQYVSSKESLYFPGFPVMELSKFVERWTTEDENKLLREFRSWVRKQLSSRSKRKR